MTRALLSLGAVVALAVALVGTLAGQQPASGTWIAAAGRPAAGEGGTVLTHTQAAPKAQKPLLKPASTPYFYTGSKNVALTFDDGPDPRWTPQVLALLRKYHVKATFCLIGVNVKAHPDLVRKIAQDGHTLCNHTTHHDEHLKKKSRAAILSDLRQTNALIKKASGGITPKYFRAPAGNWSGVIVSAARSLGMASIGWSVDPKDWMKPPSSTIVSRVRARMAPGVIVLMHDGGGDRSRSVAALKVLLPSLTSKYRLTRL
ncbi:polysaccharide deacetylase family protein [Cryptosporangium phraense]|uniref:Polysaccharide deacetylase family protein n=1 Tax=Cryptosporangium phraense TaxID=2593070 RepID=A0A545AMA6_9ACTN|nr:polysaccharide deacetylase family protein [Cryptosporangium phraense]TQS42469.1 polysaccharide deacetylase family protein [Cryptosporangium phraense]